MPPRAQVLVIAVDPIDRVESADAEGGLVELGDGALTVD
jgi:hypothetical protein